MSRSVYVHLLPALVEEAALAGDVVVVIDVLRATTTVLDALAAGAAGIVACQTVDEARAAAAALPGPVVLGGERQGLRIAGFDLGNSPREYSPAAVGGRTLVFTTTNGTRALHRARRARRVLLGALTNVSAVAAALVTEPVVHVLCAGTDGLVTAEDALAAGAIVARLVEGAAAHATAVLDDEAALVLAAWRALGTAERLRAMLRESRGGKNLLALGLGADIEAAAVVDRAPLVAVFDPATGLIAAANSPAAGGVIE